MKRTKKMSQPLANNKQSYLGNPLIKGAGVKVEFTKKQIVEYERCMNDPTYFIKNYVKIINVDRGLIPFELYPYQENIVNTVHDNRFVICKMCRQSGKSTTVASYILHFVNFNPDKKVAILANKLAIAKEILERIKRAFQYLPKWMQQGVAEWNKESITLENGSKIIAAATSSSAVRGDTFNLIMLDEFAFIPPNQAEDFFSSVYPTVSSGNTTKVLIVSTPKGMNHFYKMWTEAEEGRSDYVPISVHWTDVPGRDDNWASQQIRNTSQQQFDQEFECHFLGSANTLISGTKLRSLAYKTPILDQDGLLVYEHPKDDHEYMTVCDVSRGTQQDYSAFTVIDITEVPYKLVATYRNNKIPPLVYPEVIHRVASKYNQSWVMVETNDAGIQVAESLYEDYEYENMIMTSMKGRKGQVADSGFGSGQSQRGVKTTKSVKRIGCSILKDLIEDDKLLIDDYHTIQELSTFIAKAGSYEADVGHNDDLAMCLVLFGWVTTQPIYRDIMSMDTRKILYEERLQQIEDQWAPFGFVNDGISDPEDTFVDSEGDRWTTVDRKHERDDWF